MARLYTRDELLEEMQRIALLSAGMEHDDRACLTCENIYSPDDRISSTVCHCDNDE